MPVRPVHHGRTTKSMRRKLCFRGHQATFPRFTAHIAHTERVVIAHALYRPAPPHFSIGKAVNRSECSNINQEEFRHLFQPYTNRIKSSDVTSALFVQLTVPHENGHMTRLPVGLVDTYSAPVAPWGPSLQMGTTFRLPAAPTPLRVRSVVGTNEADSSDRFTSIQGDTGAHYGAGCVHIAGVIGSSQVSPIIWLVLSLTVCFISIF
jgi:hypothetical protein